MQQQKSKKILRDILFSVLNFDEPLSSSDWFRLLFIKANKVSIIIKGKSCVLVLHKYVYIYNRYTKNS